MHHAESLPIPKVQRNPLHAFLPLTPFPVPQSDMEIRACVRQGVIVHNGQNRKFLEIQLHNLHHIRVDIYNPPH